MGRKASSPMAPTFMVSAPGKVIVFGEHAAVYGQPAIAAAISLRSYLLVTTLSKSYRTITLNFRDINLHHTWRIDDLPWKTFNEPTKKRPYHCRVTSLDLDFLNAIRPHAEAVSSELPEEQRKMHVRSASVFLYLLLSLGSSESPGAIYTLRSTIPIGAGLGSSASVCVCLSAALLLQVQVLAGPHPDQPANQADGQIEYINNWAYVGELCTHGEPSGMDNTVSTGGKAVVFQRKYATSASGTEKTFERPSVMPLLTFPKLRLLLVDTRRPRSTSTQVEIVKKLSTSLPDLTNLILEAIGRVTRSALKQISDANFQDEGISVATESLGRLIQINHGLLVSLGVSHPRLERIRELVDYANIGWTKLTGAGGGGCAITVLRPNVNNEVVTELERKLSEEGFQTYESILGGNGVGVLWPAILHSQSSHSKSANDREEIDQEKFENAVGVEGVRNLVGVGNREGWRFWK